MLNKKLYTSPVCEAVLPECEDVLTFSVQSVSDGDFIFWDDRTTLV